VGVVLVLGLAGTGVELTLLEHYEDPWQLVPLCLVVAGLAALVWFAASRSKPSVRALQAVMILCIVAGAIGSALHFQGAAEFQKEINPSISRGELIRKVMRAKAPPVLAPWLMTHLGLLGLIYAHRRSSSR
jgi:hypothetical protein